MEGKESRRDGFRIARASRHKIASSSIKAFNDSFRLHVAVFGRRIEPIRQLFNKIEELSNSREDGYETGK